MTVKCLEVAASGPWCVRGSMRWPAGWALALSKAQRSLSCTIRRRPGLMLGSLPVATQWRTVLRGTRVMAATSSRSSRSERMTSGRHHARSAAIGVRRNAGALFLRRGSRVSLASARAAAIVSSSQQPLSAVSNRYLRATLPWTLPSPCPPACRRAAKGCQQGVPEWQGGSHAGGALDPWHRAGRSRSRATP